MHLSFAIQGPFRTPKWRLERVVQLISHRSVRRRPGQYDDDYIQIYWQILLALAAAGDDEAKRDAVFREYPDVCAAHRFHYSPDPEQRQILEARLLTDETFEQIATRFGMAPQVVEYYEKLFFDVRDRMHAKDWIAMMVLRQPRFCHDTGTGATTEAERGYVLRLFAYFGGPLALDAAINEIVSTTLPKRAEDVRGWFDNALNQIVRTSAVAAVSTLRMNQKNMMQLIKLSLRTSRAKARTRAKPALPDFDEWAQQVVETIGWEPAGPAVPVLHETQKTDVSC